VRTRDRQIDPIRLTRFTSDLRTDGNPAFSPDGRSIAYLRVGAATEDMVQALDAPARVSVVTVNTSVGAPVWTADGNRVCYASVDRALMCVSAPEVRHSGSSPTSAIRSSAPAGRVERVGAVDDRR
jgi:Tol biopolymer transport system component